MARRDDVVNQRRPGSVSRSELERRWGLVRSRLEERGLDALVAVGLDANGSGASRWLTDHPVLNRKVIAIFSDGGMLIVDHGPMGMAREADGHEPDHPGATEIITVSEFGPVAYSLGQAAEQTVTALRRRGCRAVGLHNPGNFPAEFRRVLGDGLPDVRWHDETSFLDRAKAIKSAEELRLIEAATALQDIVLAATLDYVRPGIPEYEVSAFATWEARRRGGDHGIVLVGSAPGGQAPAFMHGSDRGGRRLEAGDALTVLIETGSPAGFICEVGRNASLGPVAPQQAALHEVLAQAQAHTISLLQPGMPLKDIAASHDCFMVERGLLPERRLYAHSQGYDLVERPLIRADEDMVVEIGMHFAVHPAGVRDGYFGFVCDNVIVEADGARMLHRAPKIVYELG